MADTVESDVAALETEAERLRSLLKYAPRAFVMEFAGTPKSGKSTSVEAVRHFFSRHGFHVHVLSERAAVCPIPMKGHLFFNTWCASSMLAELLANVETATDIIIIDRGLFDALVWLTLQERRGELTDTEARTIEAFLLLERWRTLVDLAVVMSVSAEEAVKREESQRITRKGGSIMNPEVLAAIADSVSEAIGRYGDGFTAVIDHQTTAEEVRESNVRLTGEVLKRFENFLNPKILVVPRAEMEELGVEGGGAFNETAVKRALEHISSHGLFLPRDEVETDPRYVQIVPCALLKQGDKVFLFQRTETDPKYRLYGKTTIWQGCHVPMKDGSDLPELLKATILDRVARSLFLSRSFPIAPVGYCWDQEDEKSSLHFGVVYSIEIDNPHTAADLRKKAFRRQRGHGLVGRFDDWTTLVEKQDELNVETWSRAILNGIQGE